MATVVRVAVDVKAWMTSLPSVSAIRPARCPGCGVCGEVSGDVRLHGHGLRERLLCGPLAVGDAPGEHTVSVRRYRCRECGELVQVGPNALLRRRRYGLLGIVLAFVAWGIDVQSAWEARVAVSPQRVFGDGTNGRWPMLRRWVQDFTANNRRVSACNQRAAGDLVHRWAAHALVPNLGASISHRAFRGALLATARDH